MTKRCRHEQHMWLVCNGNLWWCYVCGAIRRAKTQNPNDSIPIDKRWIKPTGNKNNNPYDKLNK